MIFGCTRRLTPKEPVLDVSQSPRRWGASSYMRRKPRRTISASVPVLRVRTGSEVERRALEMIEAGAGYKIGNLADRFHLSPSHLQRLFKSEIGMPIGEWLIAQRLHRAAYLLANSYLSVKTIARSAGYEHVSSFIRAFERKNKLTPTRYRERAGANSATPNGSVA
jgi:AraC-like DNA-binding protein